MALVNINKGTVGFSAAKTLLWQIADIINENFTYLTSTTFGTPSEVQTLTNKRIEKRVGSTASSATPTINTDNYDVYRLTAQNVNRWRFCCYSTGCV